MMSNQQMIRFFEASEDKNLAIVELAVQTGKKRAEVKEIVGFDPTQPTIAPPPPKPKKNRGIADLTEVLFDSLDRINDPLLSREGVTDESKRALAVAAITGKIIQTANLMLTVYKTSTESTGGKLPELLDPNRDGEA